jgi:hypothetical protein
MIAMMPPSELSYLLGVCRNIYQPPGIEHVAPRPEGHDLEKVIRLARDNGLLYHLVRSVFSIYENAEPDMRRLIERDSIAHEQYSSSLYKSLCNVDKLLGSDNYLVIKTIYSYPRITKDLDILVRDLEGSLLKFQKEGYSHTFEEPPYKQTVAKNGVLSTTLHQRVAWRDVVPVDTEFLWQNPRRTELDGLEVQIPSIDADLITNIAHIPFESLYLNLGDALHLFRLFKEANWRDIIAQAKINNWFKTLTRIMALMNGLHRSMFAEPGPAECWFDLHSNGIMHFPIACPFGLIVRAHVEKRAWKKLFSFGYYVEKRMKHLT